MNDNWLEEDSSPRGNEDDEVRTSLWTYASRFQALFLILYLLLAIPSLTVVVVVQVRNHDGILDIWFATITSGAAAMALSGMVAYSTIEAWRGSLVLAESIRDGIKARQRKQLTQAIAQASARARAEGRAEAYGAWEAWNLRRVEAEATGETFNETPPSRNGEQPD